MIVLGRGQTIGMTDKHYSDEIICVVDMATDKIAFDGKTWKDIEDDHL